MEDLYAVLLIYVSTTVSVVWPTEVIVSQKGVVVSRSTSSLKNALPPVLFDREVQKV